MTLTLKPPGVSVGGLPVPAQVRGRGKETESDSVSVTTGNELKGESE